jgi:hypothetical protein
MTFGKIQDEYLKVLSFFGVPDDDRHEFPVHNSRKDTFSFRHDQYAGRFVRTLGIKKNVGISGPCGEQTQGFPKVRHCPRISRGTESLL